MAFRPNYQQQRGDRDRAKEQKKAEKLRRREEETAQRKSRDQDPATAGDRPGAEADEPLADKD